MKKIYAALGGTATLAGLLAGWFSYAGTPPYASAQDVKDNKVLAKTALQQAMENRVDSQQQRVFTQENIIDARGKTPERADRLRQIRAQLKKYTEAKDRSYK